MGITAFGPGKWRLDWRDSHGRRRRKIVEGSKRKAELVLAEILTKRQQRRDDPRAILRTTVREILDQYLEGKRVGKGGERASRNRAERIAARWGDTRLETLDRQPRLLVDWFDKELPRETSKKPPYGPLSQKTMWDTRATFRAALAYFIKAHRLHVVNPLDGVEVRKGTRVRHQWPRPEDYRRILAEAQAWGQPLVSLFVAGWESGQRIGEILAWRWEKVFMDPPGEELPYILTIISKQKDLVEVGLPMSRPLWEALRALPGPKEAGKVFPWAKPPRKQIRAALDRAGCQEIRFHDLRKAWNTLKKAQGFGANLTGAYQVHSEGMDSYYTELSRPELEVLVKDSWAGVQKVSIATNKGDKNNGGNNG